MMGQNAGTATIAGVVVDDHTGQPIRHADVMLSSVRASLVSQVNTDDRGRFRLDRIAAGNYVLYLASPRHVRMQYGAARPEERGRLIQVTEGAKIDGIVARMIPGAAISGTIRDAAGQPVQNAEVQLSKWGYSGLTGEPALRLTDGAYASTDDRGHYRFYQLPAGEYRGLHGASASSPWRPVRS